MNPQDKEISIYRQCHLLGISMSCYYYKRKGESDENLKIMELIDREYTVHPYYGVLRMHIKLRSLGYNVNIKRVRRLMRLMGLEAVYCKPNLSKRDMSHKTYPYLLRGVNPCRSNHIWSTDITFIPMKHGFMYLTAIIDWYSRYIIAWRLSNSQDASFCCECLTEALSGAKPEFFNSDQGSQFTSDNFQSILSKHETIKVSMDGKGRALDNVKIERFWRSLKYEYVYLHAQLNGKELYDGIKAYIDFYNNTRKHQSLNYKTPAEVYFGEDAPCLVQNILNMVS